MEQTGSDKNRFIEHIFTSSYMIYLKAAIIEHTKRAIYQAGHCWGQMTVNAPVLPSPGNNIFKIY